MKSSYFNTASKFENRVEKKWIEEKNQTLPDTDFESFFVETYDIVPQIPLQERGHLILQHLQSFVESKCNWSGGNEDEKEENKITKRERERKWGIRERREIRGLEDTYLWCESTLWRQWNRAIRICHVMRKGHVLSMRGWVSYNKGLFSSRMAWELWEFTKLPSSEGGRRGADAYKERTVRWGRFCWWQNDSRFVFC